MSIPDFVVYICGPYRASTESGVRRNIEASREAAELLWKNGIPALSPHLNTSLMGGLVPDKVFLDGDLILLSRCDCALVLPNSGASAGSQREIQFAAAREIPIIHVPCVWDPLIIISMVQSVMDLATSEKPQTRKDLTP